MKLPLNKFKNFNLSLILLVLLLLVLGFEFYFGYKNLYANLSTEENTTAADSVVRVDLKAYQDTINLIDNLNKFAPKTLNLKHPAPFK